eukprot:gene10872-12028_t
MDGQRNILVFGLTTLDIVNICEEFPEEDGDIRVSKQYWQKGGNAANTSEVLARIGRGDGGSINVSLFSCFAKASCQADFCKDVLKNRGVDIGLCVDFENCQFPTSCCIVAKKAGSRTILHSRNDLPELSMDHFMKIDLSKYNWVHFEGRGFPHLKDMVAEAARLRDTGKTALQKISLEFEKPSRYKDLIPSKLATLVDVLFISRDFAKSCLGYSSAHETVTSIKKELELPDSLIVVCAWGEAGADAIDTNNVTYHSNAFSPEKLVDTLGAGDTFNAGVLASLVKGCSLEQAIVYGCQIAGRKCGQFGYDDFSLDF